MKLIFIHPGQLEASRTHRHSRGLHRGLIGSTARSIQPSLPGSPQERLESPAFQASLSRHIIACQFLRHVIRSNTKSDMNYHTDGSCIRVTLLPFLCLKRCRASTITAARSLCLISHRMPHPPTRRIDVHHGYNTLNQPHHAIPIPTCRQRKCSYMYAHHESPAHIISVGAHPLLPKTTRTYAPLS